MDFRQYASRGKCPIFAQPSSVHRLPEFLRPTSGIQIPVHFTQSEFDSRIAKARASLVERGLDGLIMFAPESHYYLCGFDTFGFAMFQCLVLPLEGELHLLCRTPDLQQAQQTSTLTDAQIHI